MPSSTSQNAMDARNCDHGSCTKPGAWSKSWATVRVGVGFRARAQAANYGQAEPARYPLMPCCMHANASVKTAPQRCFITKDKRHTGHVGARGGVRGDVVHLPTSGSEAARTLYSFTESLLLARMHATKPPCMQISSWGRRSPCRASGHSVSQVGNCGAHSMPS